MPGGGWDTKPSATRLLCQRTRAEPPNSSWRSCDLGSVANARWHRQGFRLFWRFKSRNRGGRPRVASETIALIQQMARENNIWGAERIRGELMKLGTRVASLPRAAGRGATIHKYVRLAGPHPAHGQNWSTFLKNHAQMVWACDFLPVIDLFFRQIYAFFIIELVPRRAVHCGVTSHPTDACHNSVGKRPSMALPLVSRFSTGTASTATVLLESLRRARLDSPRRPTVLQRPTPSANGSWGV